VSFIRDTFSSQHYKLTNKNASTKNLPYITTFDLTLLSTDQATPNYVTPVSGPQRLRGKGIIILNENKVQFPLARGSEQHPPILSPTNVSTKSQKQNASSGRSIHLPASSCRKDCIENLVI
jgi:hypothetical protein